MNFSSPSSIFFLVDPKFGFPRGFSLISSNWILDLDVAEEVKFEICHHRQLQGLNSKLTV